MVRNNPGPPVSKFWGILCEIESVRLQVTVQPYWTSLSLSLCHGHFQQQFFKKQTTHYFYVNGHK